MFEGPGPIIVVRTKLYDDGGEGEAAIGSQTTFDLVEHPVFRDKGWQMLNREAAVDKGRSLLKQWSDRNWNYRYQDDPLLEDYPQYGTF